MRIRRLFVAVAAPMLAFAATWLFAADNLAIPLHETRATLVGSKYTDVAGTPVSIGDSQPLAVAFVFLNTQCPISNKLLPELNRLAALAGKSNIEFYGVLSDPAVSRADAQKHAKEFSISFPTLFDASGTLAAALMPSVTPQAFVVDTKNFQGKLLYSGRINDAFAAVGNPKTIIASNDLQDALTAIAAGKAPPTATTTPVGCIFEAWKRPAKGATVTWSRDIAPIIYANCAQCHHDGEVAPFPLMSFKDAARRADMLAAVTESKQMPPWKAADPWGTFHDERRLTPAQIALIRDWAKAGAPEGDAKDAPPAPVFSEKWHLGTPDLVVKMPKPFNVPADGRDLMTYTVVPLALTRDEYVVAFEYRPGNRKVVHHMIALLDANGNARNVAKAKGDGTTYASFGGPGFVPTGGLGGWAPGATPRFLPEGVGRPLKKGSDLILQIHYHPSGKPESDQGELALYFAKKPIKQVSLNIPLSNRQINITPGDANYIRTQTITAPVDVTLQGITPHMHNIGREMKVTATFPDGRTQQLIYINDWDWNWQDQYQCATPVKLPAGTKVDLWARFDNSKDNPRNPQNPPARVTFGEQTSNEMCIAFLQLTVDGQRAPLLGAIAGNANATTNPASTTAPAQTIRQRLQELRQQRTIPNP